MAGIIIDKEGRYVLVQGLLFGVETTIVGVYALNNAQVAFWNKIILLMKEIKDMHI